MDKKNPPNRRLAMYVGLVLLTVVVYGHGITRSQGEFIDAPHHLLNGIFVLDALTDFGNAISDPRAFAINYYQHFPAVNIGYYPPVFPICEAMVMAVVGVSGPAGQLTVLLFAVIATLFAFAWFRLRVNDQWALCATALLMYAPYLVYWGRDIMLEIPVLALSLASMYWFELLLRADRPTWRDSLLWATCTILAMWTKQHALMLLGIFAVTTLTTRRFRHLTHPSILSAIVLISISAVALVWVQVRVGGDAVGHSVGFTRQHVADRFNWEQWRFYLRRFDEVVYWPVLVAAGLGLINVIRERVAFSSVILAWPVTFYFMHSYMKAQDIRYAILAMPPVIALAVMGVRSLGTSPPQIGELMLRTGLTAKLAMAGLLIYTGIGTLRVSVPSVSPSYRQAADELCERIGPYSCLTFVPERAARPPVMHRLAIEPELSGEKDIYSFGKILRAAQVLRGGVEQWPDTATISNALIEWNVKYLLIEEPSPLNERTEEFVIQPWLDEIAAREFRLVAEYPIDLTAPRWPVRISRNDHPLRALKLFERVAPMEFNPQADPPIKPRRVPITISGST